MKKYYFTPVTKMAIIAGVLTFVILMAATAIKAEGTQPTEAQPEIELVCVWDNVPLDIELQDFVVDECKKYDIRPQIIFAMMQAESGFNAEAVGDNGQSFGLLQIQPRWHYEKMLELNCTNLLDEKQNITVGINILADLIAQGKGIEWALTAYNAGTSNADTATDRSYALAVLNLAENWGRTYAKVS
jgi:hypothetical protein